MKNSFELETDSRQKEKELVEKQLEKIKQWLNSIGFSEHKNRDVYQYEILYHYLNQLSIYIQTPYNDWVYMYDEKKVKYPYSRMSYQHYYKETSKNKWYVKFPGVNTNIKQMSFNSFKSIFSKVLSIEKIFEKIRDFTMLFENDIKNKRKWNKSIWSIKSNLIYCNYTLPSGNIEYTWTSNKDIWHIRFETNNRWYTEYLDSEKFTTTGLLYSSAFKAILPEFTDILIALQQIENEPVDKVWQKIKDGNWEEIIEPHIGIIFLKNLGF